MKAKFFMLLPVLLLGASLAGWGVMIHLATSDPSFAVEPAYYQKAARYDEELHRRRASAALGWNIEVVSFRQAGEGSVLLEVRALQKDGAPLADAELRLEAMPNVHADRVQKALATANHAGRAVLELAPAASGLWELRFTVLRGGQSFSQVVRADLRPVGDHT